MPPFHQQTHSSAGLSSELLQGKPQSSSKPTASCQFLQSVEKGLEQLHDCRTIDQQHVEEVER
ncbi:unnamed protein product, partial [Dovyalis caffra]